MHQPIDRRDFLLSSAALGALALAGPLAAQRGSPAAAARALYDEIFEAMLRTAPEIATGLGLDTGARAGLKRRLSDVSPAGRMGPYQPLVERLPRLRAIARVGLSGQERAWLDTVIWLGERVSDVATIPYGGMGGSYNYPIPYVLSQLTGAYQSVPDFIDSQHQIATAADAEAYLARLDAFAEVIDQEVARSRADAGRGVIPPAYIIDKTITQTRALRAQSGESAGLVQSLVRRARERNLAGDWGARATRIVDGPIAAALDRQLALLAEFRGRAGTSPAAGGLPDGERFYAMCLRYHTSTSLTPDQAHQIGLRQVAELQAEAEPLLRREGLTEGSVGARLTALGQQERFLYPNTDAGRTELLADLRRQLETIRARMPQYFGRIPTTGMEIRRVPEAIEVGAPRGYAQGGSLDGSRPGTYYINLVDTRTWPRWALPTLTYHESVPGHLWQGATVLGSEAIPLLHRNIGVPAFGEGWGLYAEQLAEEIGMYEDFPAGRIGRIQSFLYRAARIVLDTGMHTQGWSRERAIRYFIEQVGLNPISATSEIERYIVWPGQACSYKIGHNEIVRLRDEARARMGTRFDLRSFHDAVLVNGDMPLEILATVVAEWERGRNE